MNSAIISALFGGALIGASASLMLLTLGTVTGISGILNNVLGHKKFFSTWQFFFLLGLFCGGLLLKVFYPETLISTLDTSPSRLVIAGLLVGFGTVMGSGCTSGHGVCGISRLSIRSLMATLIFMVLGILTASII